MSINMTIFSQQMPARMAARDAEQVRNLNAEAAHGAGSVAINRISIKQSRFRIIMGGEEQQVLSASHLDVAIVRTNPGVNKTFYIKQWRPGQEPETPDCMSADGVTPLHGCKAQQADYCATCPQNAWGSRINPLTGAKGKACMDGKRLAIVPASNLSGDMFQLAVPPASLKDCCARRRIRRRARERHKELRICL